MSLIVTKLASSRKDPPPQKLPLQRGTIRAALRSCDNCRRRKARCDGPHRSDRVCTSCSRTSNECTYSEESFRRGESSKSYVEDLEARVAKVEALLRERVPEAILMQEIGALTMSDSPNVRVDASAWSQEDGDNSIPLLTSNERWNYFFGKSSMYPLIRATADSKDLASGTNNTATRLIKRPEFWRIPEHELQTPSGNTFRPEMPPPATLAALVQRFFEVVNFYYPIFHRGLFEKQLLDGQAERDGKFAAVVLLVCAVGEAYMNETSSTYSDPDGRPLGGRFFEQVEPFLGMPTLAVPQLVDVQIYLLTAWYLGMAPSYTTCWIRFGTSVQLALQAGAHRRAAYSNEPNLIDELWKRTFWTTYILDRVGSSLQGRPCSIAEDSFDLDLPLDVGDDAWDLTNSEKNHPLLVSPDPQPSSLYAFFIWRIRLHLIHGVALRTLYSSNRSRALMGFVGVDWEQRVIAKLDGFLRDWKVTLPNHLRFYLDMVNLQRFVLAALLQADYHSLQMIVHNPFTRTTAQRFLNGDCSQSARDDIVASLQTCIDAAMATCDLLSLVLERCPEQLCVPAWVLPAFNSGLILFVRYFGFRKSLTTAESEETLRHICTCLDTLALIMKSHKVTKARWETLKELASDMDQSLPPSKVLVEISLPLPITAYNHENAAPESSQYLPLRPDNVTPASVVTPQVDATAASVQNSHSALAVDGPFMIEQLPPMLHDQLLHMSSVSTA
ncbi:fungal-specific transcription factor domain-containing protein [Auriculariales sp. MPI-PUGE-AT-0066]|nr:fungal-specific transcription factor domain-containing protein [Auriculariales sp. MPI-PUGE-AT-0066]